MESIAELLKLSLLTFLSSVYVFSVAVPLLASRCHCWDGLTRLESAPLDSAQKLTKLLKKQFVLTLNQGQKYILCAKVQKSIVDLMNPLKLYVLLCRAMCIFEIIIER